MNWQMTFKNDYEHSGTVHTFWIDYEQPGTVQTLFHITILIGIWLLSCQLPIQISNHHQYMQLNIRLSIRILFWHRQMNWLMTFKTVMSFFWNSANAFESTMSILEQYKLCHQSASESASGYWVASCQFGFRISIWIGDLQLNCELPIGIFILESSNELATGI